MNFLAPIFLWLLPLVSIPIIIYLFNKNKYKTVNFSSLIFLKFIESKSIKKINIINIILLIIRTLIIILIVLMISRPIFNSSNNSNLNSSSVALILIDNSFSMENELNDKQLKKTISKIVGSFEDNSLIIIKTLDKNQELYNSSKRDFSIKNININVSYMSSNYSNIAGFTSNDNYSEYLNKYLFIISDLQKNKSFQDIENLSSDWIVNIIKMNIPENNLGISNASSLNHFIIPNELFELNIDILNKSSQIQKNRELELFIDNTRVGRMIIDVPGESFESVVFKTSLPRRGEYICYAKLDNDNNLNDNYFYFKLDIQENLNLQIIDNDNNRFLLESINSLNITNDFFNVEKHIGYESFIQNSNHADVLFIIGFSDAPVELFDYIKSTNKKCKVIIFPDHNDYSFNKISHIMTLGKETGNKLFLENDSYLEIDIMNYSEFSNLFTNNSNRSIKINEYLSLASDDSSIMFLSNQDFFLNKYNSLNSEIYLFSTELDIKASNLPLKGTFLPLMNKLISNNKLLDYKRCGEIEYFSQLLNNAVITTPTLKKYQLNNNVNQNNKYIYNEIGNYNILNKFANKVIPCNISYDEFNLSHINSLEIKALNNKIVFIDNLENIQNAINNQKNAYDLWKYFLIIVILLLIIEMYLSNFYIKNE